MKRIVLIIVTLIFISACSYYAPTSQIQESKTINTEDLAEYSESQ